MPADTFDNVKGQFPIGFFIWDTAKEAVFQTIRADVYDKGGVKCGTKIIAAADDTPRITAWLKPFKIPADYFIGMFNTGRTDFQNQALVRIENDIVADRGHASDIHQDNLIVASVFLAVQHCIAATWLNDRDQFLYPHDGWQEDLEFQGDCLAYTLFHGQNRITVAEGVNHWIPFTEEEVKAKERFESHFMTDFIRGKLQPLKNPLTLRQQSLSLDNDGDFEPAKLLVYDGTTAIDFSPEARLLLDAGRKLWQYYQEQPAANPNAAFYDIKEHFQGRNDKGRMNASSGDIRYLELLRNLNRTLKYLANHKIVPKVYRYGFLLDDTLLS